MAKYYYKLNDEGRIGLTAPVGFGVPAEEDIFDFPEGFDFDKQLDYKIIDGELVHDPIQEPDPEPTTDDILNTLLGVTE